MDKEVKVGTGIHVIDELLSGLRWGDNVVWQVTTALEYSWLVRPFVEDAAEKSIEIIYIHFDAFTIPGISPHCKVVTLDPTQGFDYFKPKSSE